MSTAENQPGSRFFSLLVKGYMFGTILSTVVLHVAVSLISPGDAGTVNALGDGAIFFLIFVMVGVVGFVAFPAAAMASWPFRRLVFEDPVLALFAATGVGVAAGAVLTARVLRMGPDDYFSGPLAGLVYGLVWFMLVRNPRPASLSDHA